MKFNPTVEVYKSVPKEKLTAEYFKTNPIPLNTLIKRALDYSENNIYTGKSTIKFNYLQGSFVYDRPPEDSNNIVNEQEAVGIALKLFGKTNSKLIHEFTEMRKGLGNKDFKAPLIAPLFENMKLIFAVDKGSHWECAFKRTVKYSVTYTDESNKSTTPMYSEILNTEIKVHVASSAFFRKVEYKSPILYREKITPANRTDLGRTLSNGIKEEDVVYLHDYTNNLVAPFYPSLELMPNETTPLFTYKALSDKTSANFQAPSYAQIKTIKQQIQKIPIGGTVYVTIMEDDGQRTDLLNRIIGEVQKIFTKQRVFLTISYIKEKQKEKKGLLSHFVYIKEDNNALAIVSGITGHFSHSSVTVKLGNIKTDLDIKFAARGIAHEILHGYASKIGFILFGTSRYFQPDNEAPYEDNGIMRILYDPGHLIYKDEKDVGNIKKFYRNLLVGHESAKTLGQVETMTSIDNRLLPFIQERNKYFDINNMEALLKQQLGDDMVKWEVYQRRLEAIINEKQDDFSSKVKYNLRTGNLSQFNFNSLYEQ